MKNNSKDFKNIPAILSMLNNTYDTHEIIWLENQMACMLASPIMFLGIIVNFIIGYLLQKEDIIFVIINSIIFLFLGISFEVLRRIKIPTKYCSFLVSGLYALWFLFFMSRLYSLIGPAIWMIACIQIVFALSRIKKDMAVIIGIVFLLSSIYFLLNSTDFTYTLGYAYFIPQTVSLAILLAVLSISHSINMKRYQKLLTNYVVLTDQKNDISALYEEISASEEELRSQNDQLMDYANDLKEGEETLQRLAYFDVLTGLPNRASFMEQLESRIVDPEKAQVPFYVVFIDIDSFKKVNDTLGHNVGDEFIIHAAHNLKEAIQVTDLLGRIGGDEFAIIIDRYLTKDAVQAEINMIREKFCVPYIIHNTEIRLTASFGIATYPIDGYTTSSILQSADMAMYEAKGSGKNNARFYNSSLLEEMLSKTRLEYLLSNALQKNEFYLVFQPQFDIKTNNIRGLEVLTRWKSDELGLVPPNLFIPIAEETGFIKLLGEWILRTACDTYKSLQTQYSLTAVLCINISAIQLADINFIDIVKKTLEVTGIEPKYLEFEITESVFIESFQNAIIILDTLKKLGISIALDDFGMGYSSLNYLKSLPIDTLKIDKSFIDDLTDTSSKVSIVGDIISLGHTLGLTVIAEGVEVPYQFQYLKTSRCDCIQGFLLAKPLEEETLRKLISEKDQ